MPPPKDPKKYEEWRRKNSESHKGKTTWMKGKKHSEYAKEQNRLKHLGNDYRKNKRASLETREKISKAITGKKHSEETKMKISLAGIGNQNAKGMKHTEEWKKQQSISHSGEKNPFYGKEHSEEFRLKISKINTGKIPWIKGKGHSEETRARLKITRMHQVFPRVDSKPEKMMQIGLSLRGIKYEKHKPIYGQPDIFIEPNICIFVDGDYWHNKPEVKVRDLQVNLELQKQGYQVIRIWEYVVRRDVDKAVDLVLENMLELA